MLKRGFWDNPRGKPPQTRRRNTNYKTKKKTQTQETGYSLRTFCDKNYKKAQTQETGYSLRTPKKSEGYAVYAKTWVLGQSARQTAPNPKEKQKLQNQKKKTQTQETGYSLRTPKKSEGYAVYAKTWVLGQSARQTAPNPKEKQERHTLGPWDPGTLGHGKVTFEGLATADDFWPNLIQTVKRKRHFFTTVFFFPDFGLDGVTLQSLKKNIWTLPQGILYIFSCVQSLDQGYAHGEIISKYVFPN